MDHCPPLLRGQSLPACSYQQQSRRLDAYFIFESVSLSGAPGVNGTSADLCDSGLQMVLALQSQDGTDGILKWAAIGGLENEHLRTSGR